MSEKTWIRACEQDEVGLDEVIRFDHGERSFAIYNLDGQFYVTDGFCTHENQHLAEGFVMDGVIQCPLHMGEFDIETGEAIAGPVCIHLSTYPTKIKDGCVFILI